MCAPPFLERWLQRAFMNLICEVEPIKGAEPKEVGRGSISSKRESAEDEGIRSSFSSKRQQDWLRQT